MKTTPSWSEPGRSDPPVRSLTEAVRRLGELVGEFDGNLAVGLTGEIGAGKTRLVSAFVAGLLDAGEPNPVSSPTFVYHQIYRPGGLTIHHFDLYRVGNETDPEAVGLFHHLEEPGVKFVEWCDRFPEVERAMDRRIEIRIEPTGRSYRFLRSRTETNPSRTKNTLGKTP